MKNVLIYILLLFPNFVIAQTNLDSLEALIFKKEGTEKVDLLNTISFNYWGKSPAIGIEYSEKAHELAIAINYRTGEARSILYKGVNLWAKGDFDTAITCAFNALKIYEETGNRKGIVSSYNNIGIIYISTSKFEEAIKYLKKSKEISTQQNNFGLVIDNNNNIGNAYISLENYREALSYFYENIELNKKYKLNHNISPSLSNIGTCLMELGRHEEAIAFIKQAYADELKSSQKYYAAISANQIGSYYLKKGNLSEALKYLKEAEKLAIDAEALEPLLTIQGDFAKYYIEKNQLTKALEYKEKQLDTKDSLYNEKSSEQIVEMQTRFDSEKKEKENELLRKSNRIKELEIEKQISLRNYFIAGSLLIFVLVLVLLNRFLVKRKANTILSYKNKLINEQKKELKFKNKELTEQYEQLKVLNATKDKFFKIVSHDLKDPLSSIISLTDLIYNEYQNISDEDKIAFLKSLKQSSTVTYKLLSDLLLWAQSQIGEITIQKETVDLSKFIETILEPSKLSALNKNIDIKNNVPADTRIKLDKNTSTVFIRNLVNNAIKFTHEGGVISIDVFEKNEQLELYISDTGIGMSPETISKLFRIDKNTSRNGTNNEKGTGLGLILCKEFIELNGGHLSVKSEVNSGSKFTITLPN